MRLRVPGVIAPSLGIVSMVAVLAKAAEVYKEGILSLPPPSPRHRSCGVGGLGNGHRYLEILRRSHVACLMEHPSVVQSHTMEIVAGLSRVRIAIRGSPGITEEDI